MAICTQCGTVMHDTDMREHRCDEAAVPKKGEEFKPVTTKVAK